MVQLTMNTEAALVDQGSYEIYENEATCEVRTQVTNESKSWINAEQREINNEPTVWSNIEL